MKLVNRTNFLKMLPGVLFAKFSGTDTFGELCIKERTLNDCDFCYQRLVSSLEARDTGEFYETLEAAQTEVKTSGVASLALDLHCGDRDGFMDADQLFVVYDEGEIEALIDMLTECVGADALERKVNDGLASGTKKFVASGNT